MNDSFTSKAKITIQASPEKVWEALTDPEKIKKYFFGTTVNTDWKEGSEITYSGEWEGKPYMDKGIITKVIPNELLETKYRPGTSTLPDTLENYHDVNYILEKVNDNETILTISQSGSKTQEEADHSAGNWNYILKSLKEMLEGGEL